MDEENVNIPVTTWIEPNIDEGRSRTDTVFVAFDEQLVDVKQDASITNLGNMWWWWYKEIVLTYTRKRTSPSKNVQASGPKLKNDTSWVNAVWNYMAKYYNAYLSNINTKKRTLRFSVPTEEDFKRLTRKAARFPDELQNEMLKDTGIYLEGLGLQTKSKAIMEFSDSAYTDSNLDTDSMTNATFGGDVLYILKEMKTDLNDIKRSISSVHSDVKQKYQRRCSWSHCVDKHARKLSPNGTCKSSLTSTDEENVLPMDNSSMSPDMLSDKDSGLFTDDCFTNSNRSNRYPLYGSVKSRINHNCKPRLRRFYVQEKPGLQDERHSRDTHNLCRHSRDTHELCHRKKESSVLSDDGFLESTFRHQWTPKTKRKPDHSKSKTKISGHLDDLPRGSSLQEYSSLSLQDYGIGMVPRGSVKVLKPRQLVTEKRHRLGRVNSTENETQHYRVLESTDKGRNNGISRDRFPHQIRTQYKTQIDERQGNNIIFSQGHPRQHAMEIDVVQDDTDISSQGHYQQHTIKIDKRLDNTDISNQGHSQQHTMQIKESQRYNGISCQGHPQQHAMQIGKRQVNDGISSQGHPQQHTMGIGKRQDNTDISCQGQSQQQLRNTEHRKNYEDKSLDDLLLLEKTISEMEQRGELDLETDGIDNPNLTQLKSTIRNDEAKEREKERAENIKTEQLQRVATEKAEKGREHGYNSSTNRHSDAVSEGRRSKGQELTDFAGNDDDMEYSMETSDNVSTMTSEATGSSFESGYSFLPNVDTKAMLQSVGLDTDGILVRVLNQNKQCIEDSSHEAKGNGIDTVLLLDASSSIDDKSFGQMKSACLNIVEFIETLAAEKGIEENVALVVFGGNPMILQHLTIDYRKLYDKIENIDPGGSSPMCIGTLLCMLELHLRGGATSISKYQIPPRVIMMTDGRPTDDNRFRQKEVEFGVKSPTVKENVLLAMDEMRHHGYEVVFVPVGQAINRVFLADMAERADGCIAEIDDLSNVKKHFLCHYTIAKVIGICRDIDFEDLFMNVMDNEAAALLSSTWSDTPFTETDVIMMKREFEKSEELKDIEYPHLNLPPIGSRVSIPAYSQSSYVSLTHFGTVIQQKSTGTIKVEWDAGMITFLDWSKDMKRLGIRTVKEPRHLTHGSLIDVGVAVTKAHKVTGLPSDTVQGRVFLTTNNGYVKVRWDDGTIGRHKYGADATFDLHIALESYPLDSYVWQYKEDNGSWVTYPTGDLLRIENAFIKRNKTVITNSGRIIFNKMTETLTRGEQKRQRDVRRIIVAEMIE